MGTTILFYRIRKKLRINKPNKIKQGIYNIPQCLFPVPLLTLSPLYDYKRSSNKYATDYRVWVCPIYITII